MPFVGQIQAQLRADNSDFRSKMDEAGQSVESLDKKLKKFGLGFGGFAIAARAVTELYTYVRDLTGPLTENERIAKTFVTHMEEGRKSALDFGVAVVGVIGSLGEWWGRQIAILKLGKDQVDVIERIAAQSQQVVETAEKEKAAAAEIGKIRAQIADTQAKAAEEAAKQLDLTSQIAAQVSKLAAAEDQLRAAGDNRLESERAQLEIAKAKLDLDKLRNTQAKQDAEAEKQRQKEAEDYIFALQDKEIERMEAEEAWRVELHIAKMDRIAEAEEKERNRVRVLDEELEVLQKQGMGREQIIAQLRQQGFAEDAILAKIEKQNEALRVGFQIRGKYSEDLSDRALEDKVRTLSSSIQQRQQRLREMGAPDTGAGG